MFSQVFISHASEAEAGVLFVNPSSSSEFPNLEWRLKL